MIIPTGYGQVNLRYSGNAYPRGAEVTFGVDNTGGPLTATDVAEVARDAWIAHIKPVTADSAQLKEVYVKLGPNATGPDATLGVAEAGAISFNCLPNQTAVLARKITALGGRHHKGRWFWPGATETQTDGAGLLNTTGFANWAAAIGAFWVALGTGDVPMVLLHSDATAPTPVTNVQTMQLMASQRRRLRKVGGRRTPA